MIRERITGAIVQERGMPFQLAFGFVDETQRGNLNGQYCGQSGSGNSGIHVVFSI